MQIVNEMEILKSNTSKNILINNETTFMSNVTWEDNVEQFENNILKKIINPSVNFETNKYIHEPYVGGTGIKQNDLWFYFYFYGDEVGLTHDGGLNYEHVGLSLNDNANLTVNVSESFFRLDFYKIPTTDNKLDFYNKKLVFTKNLKLPLGEKVYFKPIHDYIHVPIFVGSSFRNEENMNIYWFEDESVLDSNLTGNTLYMTAKYYNSIDGSVINFSTNRLSVNDVANDTYDSYYKVELNNTGKTYIVHHNNYDSLITTLSDNTIVTNDDKDLLMLGEVNFGKIENPIKFFATSIPRIYTKYKSQPKIVTLNPTNIKTTGATIGGSVSIGGTLDIINKGVCWNINESPTTGDTKYITNGGIGVFYTNITGLTQGTKYYVRAFAIDVDNNVIYGNQIDFTTYLPMYTYNTKFINYELEKVYEPTYTYNSEFLGYINEQINI